MRLMGTAALVLAMVGQAGAIECPISHALYGQEGGWSLRFMAVPGDAAPNQIAAFEITMPGAPETVFDGAVFIPNGFGQAWGFVTLDPAENTNGPPFWEGVVYALVDGGIAELGHEPGQMSPQQILFPQFAQNVWYSGLRESAFADDKGVLDTFVLRTCVK